MSIFPWELIWKKSLVSQLSSYNLTESCQLGATEGSMRRGSSLWDCIWQEIYREDEKESVVHRWLIRCGTDLQFPPGLGDRNSDSSRRPLYIPETFFNYTCNIVYFALAFPTRNIGSNLAFVHAYINLFSFLGTLKMYPKNNNNKKQQKNKKGQKTKTKPKNPGFDFQSSKWITIFDL